MSAVQPEALARLREAALSRAPISLGVRRTLSPHEFYRYPARFSPELAASAIAAFTRPGDLVADYFVGGGTTLVEARRAGRLSLGSDINSLSVFVSNVKTRLYSQKELDEVGRWSDVLRDRPPAHSELPSDPHLRSYFRNLDGDELADQRQVLLDGLRELSSVESPKAQALGRCILLRTAQWGLDMRREVPSAERMQGALADNARTMLEAASAATREYRLADKIAAARGIERCLVVHRGLPGVANHPSVQRRPAPRLVLTSPPYPGVYVNYHRWKLRGRLETPFPYFLAGQEDGNGLAYYTMGAKADKTQRTYFQRLECAFREIAGLCDASTRIVQVVGFNNVEKQLGRYLAAMSTAGFAEIKFDEIATADDGRLWRAVPGRRWWARAGDRSEVVTHTSQEVVLIHKLA